MGSQSKSAPTETPHVIIQGTIVKRLQHRIDVAKAMGFEVRNEWLDGPETTWCELRGVKILFLDLSQSATEQLEQVEQAISACQQHQSAAQRRAA